MGTQGFTAGRSALPDNPALPALHLTLKEKAGQLIMTGFHGEELTEETIALIRDCHVGGLLLFASNVRDPAQLRRLTAGLQRVARKAAEPGSPPGRRLAETGSSRDATGTGIGLFLSADQEGGVVARLTEDKGFAVFPGNMAIGAAEMGGVGRGAGAAEMGGADIVAGAGGERLAYEAGRVMAAQLRSVGLNWDLAPVLDVNNNPANPIIGVRSFGEDPHLVARLGRAMVRGFLDGGVASCGKHFPGHGDTTVDSHVDLPAIPHDLERLERVELVPFRAAVAEGVDSVMVAHITFPALDPRPGVPATFSPAIIRGLLREKMGFEGVILTDAIDMKPIADGWGPREAAVLALEAGQDIVLVGQRPDMAREAHAAIVEAVRSGRISEARLDESVGRVLRLKRKLGLLGGNERVPGRSDPKGRGPTDKAGPAESGGARGRGEQGEPDTGEAAVGRGGKPLGWDEALEVARAAVTLVRDQAGILPLKLGAADRLAAVVPDGVCELVNHLRLHREGAGVVAHVAYPAEPSPDVVERAGRAAGGARAVVLATAAPRLSPAVAALVRAVLAAGRSTVWVSLWSPYDLLAVPEATAPGPPTSARPAARAPAYVVAHSFREASLRAVAEAIFGEIPFRGRLPVAIS